MILKPNIATLEIFVVPIIFLTHIILKIFIRSLLQAIEELGYDFLHIPRGCTCVMQLLKFASANH